MTKHLTEMLGYAPEYGGRLVVHTHTVPDRAPRHPMDPDLSRALCGRYVFAQEKHSPDPTCPDCQTMRGGVRSW